MLYDKMKWDIIKYTWEGGKDLAIGATSVTYNLKVWEGRPGYMFNICGRVVTAFSGITGPIWMSIGDSDNSELIMPKRDLSKTGMLFIKPAPFLYQWNWHSPNNIVRPHYDMTDPIVTFSSDSGNLEDITAGSVEVAMINLVNDQPGA